jgi:hypothetical protein
MKMELWVALIGAGAIIIAAFISSFQPSPNPPVPNVFVVPAEYGNTNQHQLYWGFDKDLGGWERSGSVAPWHNMESGIKWYDLWGDAQGVIVIDACESTPSGSQAVHAKGGIKKIVTLPQNAKEITFDVVRVDHDSGIRFLLNDSEGQHTLGEEILSGPVIRQLSYDISAWRGETVTLEVQTFGAGTDDSGCVTSGSCCSEYIGIDWAKITT